MEEREDLDVMGTREEFTRRLLSQHISFVVLRKEKKKEKRKNNNNNN